MNFTDVSVERKNGEINAMFKSQINHSKTDVVISKTLLKTERRKQDKKMRKHFDNATRKFR